MEFVGPFVLIFLIFLSGIAIGMYLASTRWTTQSPPTFERGTHIVELTGGNDKCITVTQDSAVLINGVRVDIGTKQNVTVHVQGDIGWVETSSADVTVTGMVRGNAITKSGDISCDYVVGDITTTNGDVTVAGDVSGCVATTSGDISYAKR